MLHQVTVRNFAYFEDTQTLDLGSGGHYLLIGENDSGKTSLFEIIRGCMGASKCPNWSKPHDRNKPSIAVCCFHVSTGEYGKEKKEVVSSIIRTQTDTENESMYMKLVHVEPIAGEKVKLEIQYTFLKEDEAAGNNLKWKPVSNDILQALREQRGKEEWHKNADHILEVVSGYLKSETLRNSGESGAEQTNECERLLKTYINKTTVVTFPMTGMSSWQWTKSKLLKHYGKKVAVQEEIVTWYQKKLNESFISDQEREKERKYFRIITNRSDFDFIFDNGNITICNKAFRYKVTSVQNSPEGFYEAKKLSVLLAVKRFQTVCLEEPDKRMHPQMIARIRDLVLPQISDKVVVITSHNPSFLSPATIPKVFYFRRELKGEYCTSTIVPPLSPESDEYKKGNEEKTDRIITSGQSPLLFFASQVLLVEGESDYIFATALKEYLLTHDDMLQDYIKLSKCERTTKDKMKDFLCALQVLPMIGEANKFRYRRFCARLGKKNFFLMDFDALENNIP